MTTRNECYPPPPHNPPPPCPPWPFIFIEVVIICVDFADILAWTLPFNRNQFDGMVVVTAPHDQRTKDLCEHYHIRCVVTDVFYKGGKAFDKAAGINEGMKVLSKRGWIAHMDADILLPPRAKEMIDRSQPNTDFIYGIDRMDVPSFRDFVNFVSNPELQYYKQAFLHANAFKKGARLIREQGYVPIGFFQLWHPKGSGIDSYCTEHDIYNNHSDVNHAEQWPRNKRGFIPEIVALHLMSENDGHGNNWQGRKSKPFKLDE